MNIIGYLINTKGGLIGEPGTAYDYLLAENGLFIQAKGPLLEARIQIVHIPVRGLKPVDREIILTKGPIPSELYYLALLVMAKNPQFEHYMALTWNDYDKRYHLIESRQICFESRVIYEVIPDTILDIHSHGNMTPFFSNTDNSDEMGLKLYGVVGGPPYVPHNVKLRVGVYGYYDPLDFWEVFR